MSRPSHAAVSHYLSPTTSNHTTHHHPQPLLHKPLSLTQLNKKLLQLDVLYIYNAQALHIGIIFLSSDAFWEEWYLSKVTEYDKEDKFKI